MVPSLGFQMQLTESIYHVLLWCYSHFSLVSNLSHNANTIEYLIFFLSDKTIVLNQNTGQKMAKDSKVIIFEKF